MNHTVLYEWNSIDSALNLPSPRPMEIHTIHIYDFDNTLFKSPAPDPYLYSQELYTSLTNPHIFSNGGWWSEPRFLLSLLEEWQRGHLHDSFFWNASMVASARESWKNEDSGVLSILMTGRKELLFSSVLERILRRPIFGEILKFHGAFLKRTNFPSTMVYKTECLKSLLSYYTNVLSIKIFDDRGTQLTGFEDFLKGFQLEQERALEYQLIHVDPVVTYLPPDKEVQLVTKIFAEHNEDVKSKLQGLKTIHGPICSSGFHMANLSLKVDKKRKRYLIPYKESLKIREIVERFAQDTNTKFMFTLAVVKAIEILTPDSHCLRRILTPDASADDIKQHEPICSEIDSSNFFIQEAINYAKNKIAFLVSSPEIPGTHALLTTPHDQEDIAQLVEIIERTGAKTDNRDEAMTFKACPVFEYYMESSKLAIDD